jgi:hypothetical protein
MPLEDARGNGPNFDSEYLAASSMVGPGSEADQLSARLKALRASADRAEQSPPKLLAPSQETNLTPKLASPDATDANKVSKDDKPDTGSVYRTQLEKQIAEATDDLSSRFAALRTARDVRMLLLNINLSCINITCRLRHLTCLYLLLVP